MLRVTSGQTANSNMNQKCNISLTAPSVRARPVARAVGHAGGSNSSAIGRCLLAGTRMHRHVSDLAYPALRALCVSSLLPR